MKRTLALVVVLACLALPAAAPAATFSVSTTTDGPATGSCTPGACNLREAIKAATEGTEAENTIVLPAGTFNLTEGELSIANSSVGTVRIAGAGAHHTVIDAGGTTRALVTNANSLVLEGLTVTGGAAVGTTEELPGDGGGILLGTDASQATLRRVTLRGNTATLNGGGIAGPPEAISLTGKAVTIEDSTISGNTIAGGAVEALGGGVYVLGELTMVNSTVSGNVSESTAGAQEGGGVLAGPSMTEIATTSTTIVNSTIAGNSVGLGGTGGGLSIYDPGGPVEPKSSLTNTIIAGNDVGTTESNCGPLTITSKNDLSGDASCLFTDSASLKETDPDLGPLAFNGGETATLALLPGSPAIDAGTPEGCPATDQRGVARPLGRACDIGAYEAEPENSSNGGGSGSAGGSGSGTGTTEPGTGPGPVQTADLKLTIKPKPKKPKRGKKLGFLVTITDAGPGTATGTVFKATVPAATGKVKVPGLGKKACKLVKPKKKKTRTLTCALGDLAAGKTVKFRVPVRTKKAPKKVTVKGSVISALPDPTPTDAQAKATAKLKG